MPFPQRLATTCMTCTCFAVAPCHLLFVASAWRTAQVFCTLSGFSGSVVHRVSRGFMPSAMYSLAESLFTPYILFSFLHSLTSSLPSLFSPLWIAIARSLAHIPHFQQKNVPRSYLAIPVESQVKLAKKACNRYILDTYIMTGRSGNEAGSVIRM